MWLATAVTLMVAAPGPMKLVVTEMRLSGVERALGDLFETELVSQLARQRGLQVTSRQDVERLLGLERQRQLLGCEGESSCVAELVGALGTDAVVAASLGRVGSTLLLNVRVIGAREGKPLAVFTETVRSEEAMVDALRRAGDAIGEQLVGAAPVTARQLAWVPAVSGLLLTGAGTASLVASQVLAGSFARQGTFSSRAEVDAAVATGRLQQVLGAVGLGVGGAALVTGALMYLLGAPATPVRAALHLGPAGGVFVVGGAWP